MNEYILKKLIVSHHTNSYKSVQDSRVHLLMCLLHFLYPNDLPVSSISKQDGMIKVGSSDVDNSYLYCYEDIKNVSDKVKGKVFNFIDSTFCLSNRQLSYLCDGFLDL